MLFHGIQNRFDCTGGKQYEAIGKFWARMNRLYPGVSLKGVGYHWANNCLDYVIGDFVDTRRYDTRDVTEYYPAAEVMEIVLPDTGWQTYHCKLSGLSALYEEIYQDGALDYEIEEMEPDGCCIISIHRA